MDSKTASRRSLFGLAGAASLCCLALAPGAVGLAGGGAAAGLGAGLSQIAVTVLTLALLGFVVRWRTGCSNCD
ncbi:hypothetical protein [Natronolimnohabitans innermongolicus]|uniref:Uncharacterized protein n=1 Tax=Natronolimnohabitans innermongolicus JCM 12255 TaxID=1227499 RepID=L9WPD6_9EURY|nr:hypothetical protein [Natronolimnohabitans innermongolicus]ELY50208.1 hypothetical protein C493_19616 [Natronolimnohabitans innermongolicus JCM 12255]